jgi:type I restriction enzyme M protein
LAYHKNSQKLEAEDVSIEESEAELLDEDGGEPIPQDTVVCALTGEFRPDKPEERVLQSLVEQLHREYRVEPSDMERDVKVSCLDAAGKKKTVTVAIAVYEHGRPHDLENIIRVVLIAKANAKASDAAIGQLDLVLSNLSDQREEVYGVWTNGKDMAFRMRTYDAANGFPVSTELTDFPGPDETLADLDDADRRALRVAAGDSLLRVFNHCHDYLSTQGLRDEKAFWQLLYLIFAKILDEEQSKRQFFVGATERNTPEGQARIAKRIRALFDLVKNKVKDVFDGHERLEMNERALAYVAAPRHVPSDGADARHVDRDGLLRAPARDVCYGDVAIWMQRGRDDADRRLYLVFARLNAIQVCQRGYESDRAVAAHAEIADVVEEDGTSEASLIVRLDQ